MDFQFDLLHEETPVDFPNFVSQNHFEEMICNEEMNNIIRETPGHFTPRMQGPSHTPKNIFTPADFATPASHVPHYGYPQESPQDSDAELYSPQSFDQYRQHNDQGYYSGPHARTLFDRPFHEEDPLFHPTSDPYFDLSNFSELNDFHPPISGNDLEFDLQRSSLNDDHVLQPMAEPKAALPLLIPASDPAQMQQQFMLTPMSNSSANSFPPPRTLPLNSGPPYPSFQHESLSLPQSSPNDVLSIKRCTGKPKPKMKDSNQTHPSPKIKVKVNDSPCSSSTPTHPSSFRQPGTPHHGRSTPYDRPTTPANKVLLTPNGTPQEVCYTPSQHTCSTPVRPVPSGNGSTPGSITRTPRRTRTPTHHSLDFSPVVKPSPRASPRLPKELWDGHRIARNIAQAMKEPYRPFLDCEKPDHPACVARKELGLENLMAGQYPSFSSPRPRSTSPKSYEKFQALKASQELSVRSSHVEESYEGVCNLLHLHVLRARSTPKGETRPLLFPDIPGVRNPVGRLLVSAKLHSGSFFTPIGAPQPNDCILITFPKHHRGDVRIQLKALDPATHAVARTKSGQDIKAQYLSYVSWLFSLAPFPASELGRFPEDLGCSCEFGRRGSNGFQNEEFMCINPFHYVPLEHAQEFYDHLEKMMHTCVKDEEALEGESPDPTSNKSFCFCKACRVDPCSSSPSTSTTSDHA